MTKKKKKKKTSTEIVLKDCIKAFQKTPLVSSEMVDVISNLLYSLGACLCGFKDKGPGPEEAMKLYYENPRDLGHAFMAQSFQMNASWHETLEQLETTDVNP